MREQPLAELDEIKGRLEELARQVVDGEIDTETAETLASCYMAMIKCIRLELGLELEEGGEGSLLG